MRMILNINEILSRAINLVGRSVGRQSWLLVLIWARSFDRPSSSHSQYKSLERLKTLD